MKQFQPKEEEYGLSDHKEMPPRKRYWEKQRKNLLWHSKYTDLHYLLSCRVVLVIYNQQCTEQIQNSVHGEKKFKNREVAKACSPDLSIIPRNIPGINILYLPWTRSQQRRACLGWQSKSTLRTIMSPTPTPQYLFVSQPRKGWEHLSFLSCSKYIFQGTSRNKKSPRECAYWALGTTLSTKNVDINQRLCYPSAGSVLLGQLSAKLLKEIR